MRPIGIVVLLMLASPAATGSEPVDLEVVTRIRAEGLHRSRVMDTVRALTDEIGPRLTGSPGMTRANEWTRDKLAEWGLENARLEEFEFGRGWSFERTSVHLIEPHKVPLIALPQAWTPGTRGVVRGEAMRATIDSEEDLDKLRGKIKGKILFLDDTRDLEPDEDGSFRRYSDDELSELELFDVPGERRGDWRKRRVKRHKFNEKRNAFLEQEKAAAVVDVSGWDGGIIRVGRFGSFDSGAAKGVPALMMGVEHYNRIVRWLDDEIPVKLEIEVKARFHEEPSLAFNTLAEIPGSDLAHEIVMVGAHLDSWHGGTGATDNAAGCAVAMEAVRILQAIGVRPRRTIRIALWAGEEQGLLGSRAHVAERYATRPEPDDPEQLALPARLREPTWPLELKPDHDKLSVYFNLDNGSGRIRGIYAEENAAARPIFEAWLEPFADLGADTVTMRRTRGTDHQSFDSVGLPGFQFIQDRLEYFSRTHHSNLDVADRVQREDLMQASVVMAAFLYHAAMRDERFPRPPLPTAPPEDD